MNFIILVSEAHWVNYARARYRPDLIQAAKTEEEWAHLEKWLFVIQPSPLRNRSK